MHVYVIDDDASFCSLIMRQLRHAGFEASCWHNAEKLVDLSGEPEPGCVLLDLSLGATSGLAVLDELTRTRPEWPVIIVSGTTEVDDAIAAFRAGAIHVLRKPYRQDQLLAALAEAQATLDRRRDMLARERQAEAIRLTGREREVLTALADGKLSKNIAFDLGISLRTVEMHRSNILTKVSARNSTQAIATCRSLGLI